MRKWSRTIGLLFTAAASVYADQAFRVNAATPVSSTGPAKAPDSSDIKVMDDSSDPFANSPGGSAAAADPTTKPSEGTSVTNTDVSVNDAGTVEIHVNDANLVEVLRMLSLQSQKNIIASNQVTGHVTANLYGVTVREALDAILHANGYAYREKGNFIYVYTAKEIADMEKAERQATTEVFRLFYTPAANAVTMIKPVLSSEGQVASTTAAATGLPSGATDTGGDAHASDDMLVVTDYPDNLERVRKVLAEIDRRPQQILVEATILQANLNDDNALGVDFNVVGGVDFSQIASAVGQITGAELNGGSSSSSGSSGSSSSSGSSGSTGTGTTVNRGNNNVSAVGTGNTFSSSIPNGFKVGVVTNNVSVFLSALESTTDTVVLANPKVLALNKQKGEVIVGNEDGYVTTTVTENAQTQTVEFLKTGTRLVFRPFIGDDGYIRMEIHPEDSSGGVSLQGNQSLPHKTTTEVTSNILVKDNHTIVIGGLFRESTNTARSQVPGLGNLPLVGAAFRQQRDQVQKQEVIILLTPHIVKDDDQMSQISEDTLRDMNKLRVGVRKGMMFWGRERMAECCYETAVNEMQKEHPDRSKVLWHLDCATNLNPQFTDAIKMKEEITGKEVTAAPGSPIQRYVMEQVMADKASGRTYQNPPSVVPIKPTTQQSSADGVAPATQPVVAAENPATQPTTQPTVAMAPATQPATQPAEADAVPPPVSDEQPVAEAPEAAPATQPSDATKKPIRFTTVDLNDDDQ